MQKTGRLLCLILLLSVLIACEKEVHINLTSKDKLVVIEGTIESNQQPYVYLTNSIGFFDKIDLNSVGYIKNAIITVEDLNTHTTVQLKEYSVDTIIGSKTFSFTIYAPDVNDPVAFNFKGQVDHSYKLTVVSGGKTYESVTRIPTGNGLDSLWIEKVPNRDTFRTLHAIYVDPDTFGNSVRVQTLVNQVYKSGEPEIYQTAFSSVYNDDIVNGVKLPITIDIGYDKTKEYSQAEFQTLGFMKKGDTVTVKWSAIDKKVFKFWETMTYSQGSIGNPFASPTKIQSNIPGALGVWAGYNARFYTIVDTLQ
ncbi:hypothetical protein EMGBS15_06700 [Filimonas sp.]|nr:hypothetical protein EMGBS15_06700 [Filimonas sp.]